MIVDGHTVKASVERNAAAPESFIIIVNVEPGQQKIVRSRSAIRSGPNDVR